MGGLRSTSLVQSPFVSLHGNARDLTADAAEAVDADAHSLPQVHGLSMGLLRARSFTLRHEELSKTVLSQGS